MRLRFLLVIALVSCAQSDRILTVAEAIQRSRTSPEKKVTIVGIYRTSAIGAADWLGSDVPSGTDDFVSGIGLYAGSIVAEYRGYRGAFVGGDFYGHRVLVTGRLRPGDPHSFEQAKLEVDHIQKANKAPEPTTTSVTSPAAQEPRQP
jgi:hypothetical protein